MHVSFLLWLLDSRRHFHTTDHIVVLVYKTKVHLHVQLRVGPQNGQSHLELVGFVCLKWTIKTVIATSIVWIDMERNRQSAQFARHLHLDLLDSSAWPQ